MHAKTITRWRRRRHRMVAVAGASLLLAGALGAVSEIASTVEVSVAVLVLVVAYDQRRSSAARPLLVGGLAPRRLLVKSALVYAVVVAVDWTTARNLDRASVGLTVTALELTAVAIALLGGSSESAIPFSGKPGDVASHASGEPRASDQPRTRQEQAPTLHQEPPPDHNDRAAA